MYPWVVTKGVEHYACVEMVLLYGDQKALSSLTLWSLSTVEQFATILSTNGVVNAKIVCESVGCVLFGLIQLGRGRWQVCLKLSLSMVEIRKGQAEGSWRKRNNNRTKAMLRGIAEVNVRRSQLKFP